MSKGTNKEPSLFTANEWEASGNALMYTEMNASAVREWREQKAAAEVGATALFRAIE